MVGRHQPAKKLLEPAGCFRPHTPFPCPFVQPCAAALRTCSHLRLRRSRVHQRLAALWAAHTSVLPNGLLDLCGALCAERYKQFLIALTEMLILLRPSGSMYLFERIMGVAH